MDSVKDTLGKWGKMAADATKKAEDLAGNVWQHCKRLSSSSSSDELRIISLLDVLVMSSGKVSLHQFMLLPRINTAILRPTIVMFLLFRLS